MDIIIQSLGFDASETLNAFITEKLQGLKSDDIIRANVTLFKGPAGNPEGDYCEIRLEVPGNDHFVKRSSPYFETSVSECVELLHQMIQKVKDKSLNRRQAESTEIQDALMQPGDDEVDLEDIVK